MNRICIRTLRIPFEWFKFAFESLSNGSNLHSNASNPFRMVEIWIRMLRIPFELIRIGILMLRIPFEWLALAFKCFKSISRLEFPFEFFWRVRICIWTLLIPLKGLEFAFECFKSMSNVSKLHSNASNPFKGLEFAFERFESQSNILNLHSNALNPFPMVRISNRMLHIPFECSKLLLNA